MSKDNVHAQIRGLKIGSLAVGALAVGALAVGALAVGAVTIGRLVIGRSRIRRLEIDFPTANHVARELLLMESVRAFSEEEREQRPQVREPVVNRCRRKQEHARVAAHRAGRAVTTRASRSQVVRFVDDHEVVVGRRRPTMAQ